MQNDTVNKFDATACARSRCFECNLPMENTITCGEATCLWSLQSVWIYSGNTGYDRFVVSRLAWLDLTVPGVQSRSLYGSVYYIEVHCIEAYLYKTRTCCTRDQRVRERVSGFVSAEFIGYVILKIVFLSLSLKKTSGSKHPEKRPIWLWKQKHPKHSL